MFKQRPIPAGAVLNDSDSGGWSHMLSDAVDLQQEHEAMDFFAIISTVV